MAQGEGILRSARIGLELTLKMQLLPHHWLSWLLALILAGLILLWGWVPAVADKL